MATTSPYEDPAKKFTGTGTNGTNVSIGSTVFGQPVPPAPIQNNATTGVQTTPPPVMNPNQASGLNANQQSATNWINNSASGQGGINKYITDQLGRYNQAVTGGDTGLANRLTADSQRVGYNLPSVNDVFKGNITDQYNTELNAKKLAIQQELEKANQARGLALAQNQNYLNEGLTRINQQTAVDSQGAQELQNRRGGFYSGGLDYQLGGINRNASEARSSLEREIAARNSDLSGQQSLNATQAAEKIAQLESAAPAEIQARLSAALNARNEAQAKATAEQNANDIKLAGVTGYYNNSAQQQAVQEQMDRNSAAYANADPNEKARLHAENVALAQSIGGQDVTGEGDYAYGPGTATLAREKQDYDQAYTAARDQIKDQQWQTKFDFDTQKFGLEYAADQAYKNGQLSIQERNAATSAAREERLANSDGGSSGGGSSNKPAKIDAKGSAELSSGLTSDFEDETFEATAKENGFTPKELAIYLINQNKDSLTDADYKDLLKQANDL